jgi:hypothetical protein
LVQAYLANGGKVNPRAAYQTTPLSKIRFKFTSHPAWAGGTGIPPELRKRDKLFRVGPKLALNSGVIRYDPDCNHCTE